MIKKVSASEKEEISSLFVNGVKISEISQKFGFSSSTITRQLQKYFGKERFLEIKNFKKNLQDNSNSNKSKEEIILEKNNIESKSFYVDIISKSDVQNNKISTLHCKICLPLIKKLKIKNFIKEKIESSFISNSLKESINISYEYIFNR